MLNAFENFPQKDAQIKEYPKEFGNDAGEKMVANVLENIPGCESIQESSKYDDQIEGRFDIIMDLSNGSRLAIDITDTSDPERQKEKIKKIIKEPLVIEHDDKGQIIDYNKMPRVLVKYDMPRWGRAYNNFLAGKTSNPLDGIDQENYLKMFHSQIIECLETQKHYHPKSDKIYQSIINFLKQGDKK
jgi:hypothetical protein